jgi:asparagine synthetase B (glutamine-hydrolysing)
MSDVPYGVLLSGGLDSITSAVAKKYAQKRIESGDVADAWYPITLFLCWFRRFRFSCCKSWIILERFTTKLNSLSRRFRCVKDEFTI